MDRWMDGVLTGVESQKGVLGGAGGWVGLSFLVELYG